MQWIVDPKIRDFCSKLIDMAPDYFWEVSSSSTNKYHPSYAIGPGGLVRHSKSAAKILHELLSNLEMFNKYSQDKKDMMLVAIIAHDFFKHGLAEKAGKYTVTEHPIVCADFIRYNDKVNCLLERDQIEFIAGCVETHMGFFSKDYRTGKKVLPEPQTGPQHLVHLADYLASRKYLIMDFGDDYYEPIVKEAPTNYAELGTDLEDIKNKIVLRCKTLIADGMDNKQIYALIAEKNGGNRNPNSISDIIVANTVLHMLEELNV